jgi:tryptophan halogenase
MPNRAPALASMRDGVPVAERLAQIRAAMAEAVATMPSHGEFIARHCAAPPIAA